MGKTVLIMIILLTIIIGTMFVSLNNKQIQLAQQLAQETLYLQSVHISESGIYQVVSKITDMPIDKKYTQIKQSLYDIGDSQRYLQIEKDSEYKYSVLSIGRVQSHICSTFVIIKRMPYTQYTLFVNSFPSSSYCGNGQSFSGSVYVNGNLNIGQIPGPIFYDNVYCTGIIKYTQGASQRNYKGFKKGVYEKFPLLNMPTDNTKLGLSNIVSKAYNIDNIKQIKLSGKLVQLIDNKNKLISIRIQDLEYPILYKSTKSDLSISGILDKQQLTIGTQGKINIVDNIKYSDLQYVYEEERYSISNGSKSKLTLMSNDYINIDKKANKATLNTTYDVIVCANIFTTKSLQIDENSFEWKQIGLFNKETRKLIVIGSRTQGWMDNSTYSVILQKGLAQNIVFDQRNRDYVPFGVTYPNRGVKISSWIQKTGKI